MDRTRKLVSKLYTSFVFWFSSHFRFWHRVNSIKWASGSLCRHSDYFFSLSSTSLCVVLFCAWWWSIPLCLQRYMCLPTRLKFINDHTPCSLVKPKRKKRINHTKSNLFRVFCRSHQIIIIVTYYIMCMDIESMLPDEESFVVLSVCWWIFNKLSSAFSFSVQREKITIIIRGDLFRLRVDFCLVCSVDCNLVHTPFRELMFLICFTKRKGDWQWRLGRRRHRDRIIELHNIKLEWKMDKMGF